jgi:hypothetical protein
VINPRNIFSIRTENEFNDLAIRVFNYQYKTNKIYRDFVDSLRRTASNLSHYSEIPFLPISFFRTHEVISGEKKSPRVFTSSATSSNTPSKHFVSDLNLYEESFTTGFENFYGPVKDYVFIALLPSYLEREGSSLVYMADQLIKKSGHKESGFYLDDYKTLVKTLNELKESRKKTLLLGVTYALLDLAEMNCQLNENFIVMETGGMKGKRKELLKEELHAILKQKLKVSSIHSEYGMTELLSQAYSKGDALFECPEWMKILIRDIDDPLTLAKPNKTGGVNVIDLANFNSCSFIATQDLGRLSEDGKFNLMGRFDNSDIRGCNLMVS